jgi:hypothetical protein
VDRIAAQLRFFPVFFFLFSFFGLRRIFWGHISPFYSPKNSQNSNLKHFWKTTMFL